MSVIRNFWKLHIEPLSLLLQFVTVAFLSSSANVCVTRWRFTAMRISHHIPWRTPSWLTVTFWKRLRPVSPLHLRSHRPKTTYRDKSWGKRRTALIGVQSIISVFYYSQVYFCPLVERLSELGTTALGPAALLTIAMASRHPGSKVGSALVLQDHTSVFVCLSLCTTLYMWPGVQ